MLLPDRRPGVSVAFADVRKAFGAVQVLHGVSFDIQPGTVVGLLGENGAGKSTLMKILAGYELPSGGEVRIDGHAVRLDGPRAAEALGIAMIHQEFALAEDLTIAQNVFLGHEIRRGLGGIFLDNEAMHAETARVLEQVGLRARPDTPVKRLIVAEKQLVEIAKALQKRARLLIMDEPTATLTPGETERLFALIARLKSEGVTMVYISHKLDEVERVTDDIVVMRDGRFVAGRKTAEVTRREMANLMIGRELSDLYPPKSAAPAGAPRLKVTGLTVPGWAKDVSFEVAAGEILGFAGLVGAGRTELFEGLLGLRQASAGRVEIDGTEVRLRSPREAAKLGLTYLSEDRKGKGLHVDFGLRQNLTLMALQRYTKPLLDAAAETVALKTSVDEFGIRTGSLDIKASSLSGGNQQKLALAKVLHPDPRVIVLDEPTRGVDVGAKRDIYFLIQRLAREGRAVIVISSELMELIGICHRIVVMRGGAQQATLAANEDISEEVLIAHATGTH
ncbi:sugar ABC transporter ATP-binding protein [Paucibacter sp. R3-3]|uniref:Sugar ABC transporter ATP-binding protein n=1 Tax=Roseateles agri TaxID=3098619 RepID=A0ABU5DLY3_9BURK|nr:sugar ABC transporter ATP-binding protein [Paucibacter sp. R3-3]MDY0747298.1 sugar ABC transporter ATP-binding protein [Paucibacter sp. R3-3]